MATLSSRIQAVQEAQSVQERLEALPCAWVLVFDADTEDEAVYSMEVHDDEPDSHVVLAFEDREEAEAYALSLTTADPLDVSLAPYDSLASVQGLDVEALVVTSRDADFRVGLVFQGDLLRDDAAIASAGGVSLPLITGGVDAPLFSSPAPRVSVSITMVPDSCFEGRTTDDFLDPSEDPIWVLVHDEGTGDAELFKMQLNGSSSVICFKDEAAAVRCSQALRQKGAAAATARSVLIEDLVDRVDDAELEICLVDEVIETVLDDVTAAEAAMLPSIVAKDEVDELLGATPTAMSSASESSLAPAAVREMLEGLYDGDDSADAARSSSRADEADGAADARASCDEGEAGGGSVPTD